MYYKSEALDLATKLNSRELCSMHGTQGSIARATKKQARQQHQHNPSRTVHALLIEMHDHGAAKGNSEAEPHNRSLCNRTLSRLKEENPDRP